jgi:hypothetical protein
MELAPLAVDRDRLMFAAGRASANPATGDSLIRRRSHAWFWPSATALMTAACIMLAAMLIWRRADVSIAEERPQTQPKTDHLVHEPTREDFREVERLTDRFSPLNAARPGSGYLGVRYVAVAEAIGATAPEWPKNGTRKTPKFSEPSAPATSRNLLEDLLSPSPSGRGQG